MVISNFKGLISTLVLQVCEWLPTDFLDALDELIQRPTLTPLYGIPTAAIIKQRYAER